MDFKSLKSFWDCVDLDAGVRLREGCGCYVFVTRGGPGYRPWYVGRTKRRFEWEVFAPRNRLIYEAVMNDPDERVGLPYLFLVARLTDTTGQPIMGKLWWKEAEFVERLLIIDAYNKNPKLKNVQGVNYARLTVPGVFKDRTPPGRELDATRELRKALGTT